MMKPRQPQHDRDYN